MFQGLRLFKGVRLLTFLFFYLFFYIFSLAYKKIKLSVILRGLCLFKGLCLLFLSNVPGATLIQGATLDYLIDIVYSSVHLFISKKNPAVWPYSIVVNSTMTALTGLPCAFIYFWKNTLLCALI